MSLRSVLLGRLSSSDYTVALCWGDIVEKEGTLVVVWIGINDINDSANLDLDFPAFYDILIGRMLEAVEEVYELGYENFLFVNLPPLDRSPGNVDRVQQGRDARPNGTMVEWWNGALERRVGEFERGCRGVRARVFDANGVLNRVLDQPGEVWAEECYGVL